MMGCEAEMPCKQCKQSIEKSSRFCNHCRRKQYNNFASVVTIFVLLAILLVISFTGAAIYFNQQNEVIHTETKEIESTEIEMLRPKVVEKEEKPTEKTSHTEIIEKAQQTVYTVYTESKQGSAFLYNEDGAVITNAHVVEGSLDVIITTVNGEEHSGTVIGYSTETDVAVIDIPSLKGEKPFPLEKKNPNKIGEEVIALGTPLGLENTATMGYITGSGRDLVIPESSFTYENVYQISAPIESGNSGGPLVSMDDEKIIAINSAKSLFASHIGFSLPLYSVTHLIDEWIQNPLSEEEIIDLYYNNYGNYFYDELWDHLDDYYFDGGDFSDDEQYYYYWEYDDYNTWQDSTEDDLYDYEEYYEYDEEDFYEELKEYIDELEEYFEYDFDYDDFGEDSD